MAKAKKTAKKGAKASPVTTEATTIKKGTATITKIPKNLPGWPEVYTDLFNQNLKISQISELTGKSEAAVYAKRKSLEGKEKAIEVRSNNTPVAVVTKIKTGDEHVADMLVRVDQALKELDDLEESKRSLKVINKHGSIIVDPAKVSYFETDGLSFNSHTKYENEDDDK